MDSLNLNRGIQRSYEANCKEIHFWDLKISVRGDLFITSTFFKSTDRNSYILVDSCHHASWLRSVPKSQYMRLKRNCTEPEEFLVQAGTLTYRFLDKRHSKESLFDTLNQVMLLDRADLLKEISQGQGGDNVFKTPFITSFSNQHQNINHFINKHWHILGNNRILNTILPVKPWVVFPGVPSLGDKLAPNVLNPPKNKPYFFRELTDYYQCRKC